VRRSPNVVVPLIGARSLSQLQDNLGALDVELSEAHAARLDAASGIDLGFPHNFLAQENIREIVSGGTFGTVDHHRRGVSGEPL
jgi:hypothetical protein